MTVPRSAVPTPKIPPATSAAKLARLSCRLVSASASRSLEKSIPKRSATSASRST